MKKKFKDYERNSSNPFLRDMKPPIIGHKLKEIGEIAKDNVEIKIGNQNGETGIGQTILKLLNSNEEVLTTAIKKKFEKNIKYLQIVDGNMDFLKGMTSREIDVWCYISRYLIKFNTDIIILNIELCMEHIGTNNRNVVYDAIATMIDKKMLAKHSETNLYYINPKKFFKGSRRHLFNIENTL